MSPLILRILILAILVPKGWPIRWMALLQSASVATIDQADHCDGLAGLTRRQVRICKRNLEVMEAVRNGARLSLRECQWQFRARRWNCTTVNGTSLFGKEISDGTREAAFLHAVSAAGVAHAVTRACSGGALGRCGCDRTVRGSAPEGFRWSGCSDNVHFGAAFARSFVDARDLRDARGKKSARALVNLHNNEAGRKIIEYNMRVECKCHGVSGSCETKTCWRALPRFRHVGAELLDRFDRASEVMLSPVGRGKLVSKSHYSDVDLLYMQDSPDFCEWPGTRGRPCNLTSTQEGCDVLCCGRGYETRREKVLERCDCKFYWCCFVKCRECEIEVETHYCL